MEQNIIQWFKKGGSKEIVQQLKSLIQKLLRFEIKAMAKKGGFMRPGSKKTKTWQLEPGAASFMKGWYAQETQEETAARYLKEDEITRRGLSPDATEEEQAALKALEEKQRASSAGEGFWTKPTFMKKRATIKSRERAKNLKSMAFKFLPPEIKAFIKLGGRKEIAQKAKQEETLEEAKSKAAAGKKTGFAGSGMVTQKITPAISKMLLTPEMIRKYDPELADTYPQMKEAMEKAEMKAAAGKETGFAPLAGVVEKKTQGEELTGKGTPDPEFLPIDERRETSTTAGRSQGRSKSLSQMISKHLPPEVKAFMKPGGYSKKLWGMALKYVPPEAKEFLKLGGGKRSAYKGAARKTGFTPLGRGQAKARKVMAGPPSFMKGQFTQETQEDTAARYLKEDEITQRGLAADSTEDEQAAQQALEQRQRASSAGEGFFGQPTFMKKRERPSLPPVREVEKVVEDRETSTKTRKAREGSKNLSRMIARFLPSEVKKYLKLGSGKKFTQKTIRSEIKTLFEKSGDRGSGGSKAKQQFTSPAPALFTKQGAAGVSKPEGMVIDQPFDRLKMPKESDKYTTFKDRFEKESNVNNTEDEAEKNISELEEKVKKNMAMVTTLEQKLTKLEAEDKKSIEGIDQSSEGPAHKTSMISHHMNRVNPVVWSSEPC